MSAANEILAQKIKALRTARGLSQQALAERAGLSENMVGAIERGERFASAPTFEALARALSADLDPLFGALLQADEGTPNADVTLGRERAIRELAELLRARPERIALMVLDLSKRVLRELPETGS